MTEQQAKGYKGVLPETAFDVYDLAALAYLYKRVKETELISEAHHIVIDEAQDFGMMVYAVLKYCVKDCTYTIMGDVSQNIHMGYGLDDWEEAKEQMLSGERDAFCILKKSYRNTVEISDFAADILAHGSLPGYSAEPVLRHGDPVLVEKAADDVELIARAEAVCRIGRENGFDTIAVICRDEKEAERTAKELGKDCRLQRVIWKRRYSTKELWYFLWNIRRAWNLTQCFCLIPAGSSIRQTTGMRSFYMWRRPARCIGFAYCTQEI